MLRRIAGAYGSIRRLRRFQRREDGATVVEFALVALPFFGLIFAILELAIFFFASRFLEDAVFNMSRKILTQRIDPANACTTVKNEVSGMLGGWLDPTKLSITFSTPNSFTGSASNVDLNGSCSGLVTPGQVVVITASYPYPFTGFRFVAGATSMGKDMQLTARTAFRIEP